MFPLLRLPKLALIHVLKQMEFYELILLSAVSESCQSIVRLVGKKYPLDMIITNRSFRYDLTLKGSSKNYLDFHFLNKEYKVPPHAAYYWRPERIRGEKDYHAECCQNVTPYRFDGTTVSAWFDRGIRSSKLTLIIEDTASGLTKVFRHLLKTFPALQVFFDGHYLTDDILEPLLNTLEEMKPVLTGSVFNTENIRDDFYERILKLDSPRLSISIFKPRPLSIDNLRILELTTMEDLQLLTDCTKIKLEETSLTSQELNLFIKKWIEGKTKLMKVKLILKEIDIKDALDGIQVIPIKSGYEIQQKNGLKANISMKKSGYSDKVFKLKVIN